MSQSELFIAQLDDALMAKAGSLTKEDIPQMKEYCRTFETAYMGIYKVFLEKGIIQEDQYDYEQKISDIKIPPSDPFPESDTFGQMNIRLKAYNIQLDYLNNFFFMSPETLDLKTIKNIIGLLNYFHWADLSVNSAHVMSRIMAAYLDKVKQSGDTMAVNILANSTRVLIDLQKKIKLILKKISVYAKQSYKLKTRVNVLQKMTLDPGRIQSDPNGTMQAIKFEFPAQWPGNPFFKELIEEILDEDFSPQGEQQRAAILKELEVTAKTVKKKKVDRMAEIKKELLISVAEMAKIYIPLETIITRLNDNSMVLDDNVKGFAKKLARWFNRVMKKQNEIFYDIEDSRSGRGKKEHLNFTSYLNWARNKANSYKALSNPNGVRFLKVQDADLESIEEYLERNQQDLKKMINRLTALEKFFKSIPEKEIRSKMKGYKAELQQMKMVVANVVAGIKEFKVAQEEIEQLKALGIDPNE